MSINIQLRLPGPPGPPCSISLHPDARYFSVDKVTRDQVEDYARRKGMPLAEIERWLSPNLGYDN